MTDQNEKEILVQASKLVKTYHGRRVVNEVSFNIRAGEVVGLLGPNGAGKTTSFYQVMGLVRPDSGTITFRGVDVTSIVPHFWRNGRKKEKAGEGKGLEERLRKT